MTDHPDFLAADPARRWTRPLHELAVRLREAAWKAHGKAAWWILPGGACVSMRVIEGGPQAFQKQLRISRRGIKTPDKDYWLAEVRVFQKHLGCDDWGEPTGFASGEFLEREQDAATYRAVAVLLEPTPLSPAGKLPSTEGKCAKCGRVTPHEPAYLEDLCTACATAAGTAETAALRAKRVEQATLPLDEGAST